ncbi:MAG: 3-deoxy-7-phosphoheptulonate synthase [Candidatus Eremiobacteraeota bacterium]|nr:3-deoxy-7-phosphoheptulonate synthase [Candidatus Eremiobacteraeota bacterium]
MALRIAKPTDDVRILELRELATPDELLAEFPCGDEIAELVFSTRQRLHAILHGSDDRLIVVVGPCSIHDVAAGLDYARRLAAVRKRFADTLEIVMRVYFEKPRTTVGWKGLINDPRMDGSFAIDEGLRIARQFLLDVNALGVPAGSEFLDTISPQYVADLISWGAIGARTTESQVHRELASGLSCPVGFKNGTDGNVRIAIDAIKAAREPHRFLSVTKSGRSAIVATAGNDDCHVILRGGKQPNFDARSIEAVGDDIATAGLTPRLMVDASHGNSSKVYGRQLDVCADVARQLAAGEARIAGVMLESFLTAGRQDARPGIPLQYGQSVTDGCLGWDETEPAVASLARAVEARRRFATLA